MNFKRVIYSLPIMKAYRDFRSRQLSLRHTFHSTGFKFSGNPVYLSPTWEPEERAIFNDQILESQVFIDIGANQGIYTLLAASLGKTVAAIEPEPANLRFLLSNISLNQYTCEVYATAVGRTAGVAEIYGDGDSASLVPGWIETRQSFAQRVTVNTIDNLFAHRWAGAAIFIKMDVEGFELSVLEGARMFLDREPKPHWLIETFPVAFNKSKKPNTDFVLIFELMAEYGYRAIHAETKANVSLEQARDWGARGAIQEVGRSNYLFLPQ